MTHLGDVLYFSEGKIYHSEGGGGFMERASKWIHFYYQFLDWFKKVRGKGECSDDSVC